MNAVTIDEPLVRRLVASQFPQWARLPVRRVVPGGWDNATFRLGDSLALRLPTAAEYVPQIEKQHTWLPRLAPALTLRIPQPVAIGAPADRYPWKWSITTWLDGEAASRESMSDGRRFASDLAGFLRALQSIGIAGGPSPGRHNFHRGGALRTYDEQARRAIEMMKREVDVKRALDVWTNALDTSWQREPVWIHGDVTCSNLLVIAGRLSGVIDFGMLGVGDPACDFAIAWTFLEPSERQTFRRALAPDDATWARGRAWALWKSAIVAAGLVNTNAVETSSCRRTLDEVLRHDD